MRTTVFATIAGMGGLQMHGRGLARALLRSGHEVQMLSSVLDAETGGQVKRGENDGLLQAGARIVYLPARESAFQRWRDFMRLWREVAAFRPEVLIGAGKSWHLGLLGLMLSKRVRKIFFEGMSGEANGPRDPRWMVRWCFDEVVGQSARVAQNFKASFGWRKRLGAIPAFPEPLEITARLPLASRKIVPSGTARAALFSRLVEGKQALWLVHQWPVLQDLVSILDIHGCGPERPAIDRYIATHGLQERIRCCGTYPSGQLYAELLATYDLTLLPTVFPEGAPLVLLESMACGVPFVANGMGGIPDYSTGNPDCVVVPKQSVFLEGVTRMVNALAQGEIDQGRLQRFYLTQYSQASIEKQWLHFLAT